MNNFKKGRVRPLVTLPLADYLTAKQTALVEALECLAKAETDRGPRTATNCPRVWAAKVLGWLSYYPVRIDTTLNASDGWDLRRADESVGYACIRLRGVHNANSFDPITPRKIIRTLQTALGVVETELARVSSAPLPLTPFVAGMIQRAPVRSLYGKQNALRGAFDELAEVRRVVEAGGGSIRPGVRLALVALAWYPIGVPAEIPPQSAPALYMADGHVLQARALLTAANQSGAFGRGGLGLVTGWLGDALGSVEAAIQNKEEPKPRTTRHENGAIC